MVRAEFIRAALTLLHAMLFNGESVSSRGDLLACSELTPTELLETIITDPTPQRLTAVDTLRWCERAQDDVMYVREFPHIRHDGCSRSHTAATSTSHQVCCCALPSQSNEGNRLAKPRWSASHVGPRAPSQPRCLRPLHPASNTGGITAGHEVPRRTHGGHHRHCSRQR